MLGWLLNIDHVVRVLGSIFCFHLITGSPFVGLLLAKHPSFSFFLSVDFDVSKIPLLWGFL